MDQEHSSCWGGRAPEREDGSWASATSTTTSASPSSSTSASCSTRWGGPSWSTSLKGQETSSRLVWCSTASGTSRWWLRSMRRIGALAWSSQRPSSVCTARTGAGRLHPDLDRGDARGRLPGALRRVPQRARRVGAGGQRVNLGLGHGLLLGGRGHFKTKWPGLASAYGARTTFDVQGLVGCLTRTLRISGVPRGQLPGRRAPRHHRD